MKKWEWLNQSDKWIYPFEVEIEEVLVEYDGPSIAFFSEKKQRQYFGIMCDEIDGCYRWMLAPVSGAEKIAICSGTVQLIDVFKKRFVWFSDFDDDYAGINVWHVDFSIIPSGILPKPGQPLPSFAVKPMSDFVSISAESALIKLDGERVRDNSLPFRELGKFLVNFQEYWDRLSKSELIRRMADSVSLDPRSFSSLSFCASSEGSVNIHFKTTSEIRDGQAFLDATIKKLSLADDSCISPEIVADIGSVGIANAAEMYSLMHVSGLDMLIVTNGERVFVGAEKAGMLASKYRKAQKTKQKSIVMRGHFCAGRNKKSTHSFEFVNELDSRVFKGKISPSVWRYTAISVGSSEYYEVEIDVYDKVKENCPSENTYTLTRAEKMVRPSLLNDETCRPDFN